MNSEEQFKLLVDSIKDYAIYITDNDGYIITWNAGAESIKGYKASEIIGKHISVFYTEEEQALGLPKTNLSKAIEYGRFEIEGWRKRKDGSVFWANIIFTPLYESGNLYGFAKITRDITEKRKAEEKIRNLNEELEAFSYSVSHDLRAPLRAIGGFAKIFEEDFGSSINNDAIRLLRVIKENATKMGILIDDLLTFSRLGKKEIRKTSVNMTMLTETALNELSKSMPHSAKIVVDALAPAFADPSLIHQVLMNLIANAIKYSSKKENPIITISSEQKADKTIYCIKDNGAGFNMKYAHKLFGVFQRLHSENEFEGTGVGLAIVQRIVNKHGGEVWAQSREYEGASFYFSLPVS